MKTNWQSRAERLAQAIPISRFDPAVLEFVQSSRRSNVWTVAFSGGADSLALLLLLWAHFPHRRTRLVALHFNHRLRGAAAERDAAFCEKVGESLGVPVRVGKWRRSPAPGKVSEAAARAARHAFFELEMARAKSKTLWLAHHLDDVAETVLMRLARGSGAGGLSAPRAIQRMTRSRAFLRPLVTMRKSEIVDALRAARATWREDASNATPDYFRNRIRHRVMPALMEAAGRDALAGIGLSRARLEEDDAALEQLLDGYDALKARSLDWSAIAHAPRALRRRALHRWLLKVRPRTDLSRQGFEQLLAALDRGRCTRFSLGADSFAVLRQGRVKLVGR